MCTRAAGARSVNRKGGLPRQQVGRAGNQTCSACARVRFVQKTCDEALKERESIDVKIYLHAIPNELQKNIESLTLLKL